MLCRREAAAARRDPRTAAALAAVGEAAAKLLRDVPFDELLERSSLGTPEAKRLRAESKPEHVAEVLRRADILQKKRAN
jgi:hypothetical protein